MIKPEDAYPHGSIVNLIALQNLLSLRQKSADPYFEEKAKEQAIATGNYKQRRIASTERGEKKKRTSKSKTVWVHEESGSEIPFEVIRELKYIMIKEFVSMGKVSEKWLPPKGVEEKIPPPKSREDFARHAGIDEGHYKQVEKGEVPITLDDAIKICRAYNIDIAKFLTPPLDNLEKDFYFDLFPMHPTAGPIYMYQWMMWVHGYKELPGQDPVEFRTATALPVPFNYGFHGGRWEDYELRKAELERMKKSEFNASWILNEFIPKKTEKVSNSPYLKVVKEITLDKKYGISLIKATRRIATAMKVVFRTDNGKMGLKKLDQRFTRGLGVIRHNIVYVVRILLGLGK